MHSSTRLTLLALLATLGLAAPAIEVESFGHSKSCPILFDGRVSLLAKGSDFDKDTSVYNPKYDLGASMYYFIASSSSCKSNLHLQTRPGLMS
jgi:hypothetical protein